MNTEELRLENTQQHVLERTRPASARLRLSPAIQIVVDVLIGILSYWFAWLIRMYVYIPFTQDLLPQERWDVVEHLWVVLILSQAFFPFIFGLHDDLRVLGRRELLTQTFISCTVQVVVLASLFYLTDEAFPRTVILLFGVLNFVGLASFRVIAKALLHTQLRRVLVVAETLSAAQEIVAEIQNNPWMGMNTVGIVADNLPEEGVENADLTVLGRLAETEEVVRKFQIDEVIFAAERSWRDEVLSSLSNLQAELTPRIAIQPSVYEIAIGRLRHINIHDTPLIEVRGNPNEPFQRFFKRGFDIFLAALGLVISVPFIPFIMLAIVLSSPGPVFYSQERVGRGGRLFRLLKFRTMIPDAEKVTGERFAEENDPRVIPVGRLLRRFRVDEIPQLVNVLRGEMSFVGPRPERPVFVEQLARQLIGYRDRHKVKPGITGLAQVRGFYDTSAQKKLKYDLAYIYNYSFSLDLLIILETIKTVLTRRGS
ncbi:MAG: sugar transferase [Acidobacteriota bacterium]|nr:MAG: sugar transferase [Acidobacteriota bacterium]